MDTPEKEDVLDFLRKEGISAISKIHRLIRIPYYKLKYNIIPELEKENKIIIKYDPSNRYLHIDLKKSNTPRIERRHTNKK